MVISMHFCLGGGPASISDLQVRKPQFCLDSKRDTSGLVYIKARERAFRPQSIESGCKKAGIYPFNPDVILNTFTSSPLLPSLENATEPPLDTDALDSQIITDENLGTPRKAFVKGLLRFTVRKQAESFLLRKDLREKEVLLDTHRTRKSGKRIALKDRIIVSWEFIQREVEKRDNQTSAKKKMKGKHRARVIVIS
jgi:hypothetical protein